MSLTKIGLASTIRTPRGIPLSNKPSRADFDQRDERHFNSRRDFPPRAQARARGKVRDVYEVDEQHLLIIATDRISAFDCVLPTQIERKARC